MLGWIGNSYGMKLIFLTPEYLSKVNFLSFFMVGISFGGFLMTWNQTTYLITSYRFPFLASLDRPFTKFCLNNSIIPLLFLGIYCYETTCFQLYYEQLPVLLVIRNVSGFICGVLVFISFNAIYFQLTNHDIYHVIKKRDKAELVKKNKSLAPGIKAIDLDEIKQDSKRWRVDTYLNESLRPRLVRSVQHYDNDLILSLFRQNHYNALFWQAIALTVLLLSSLLAEVPEFQIPVGASILILIQVFISLIGFITYWLARWRDPAIIILLLLINHITRYDTFNYQNRAYGLDYKKQVNYDYSYLEKLCSSNIVEKDKAHTQEILNRWLAKITIPNDQLPTTNDQQPTINNQQPTNRPKMVIFCASGGGLRAALWAMQVLAQTDSITHGRLMKQTTLMAGASGGMLGSAYYRELCLRKLNKQKNNTQYLENISKDLLNTVGFMMLSNDMFLPLSKFQYGTHSYHKDRGYIFERQLSHNTEGLMDKSLEAYESPENDAQIPMMYLSPTIVNDARRMIISPQGVSFMMIPPGAESHTHTLSIDAVDFRRLFNQTKTSDSLRFLTALRANATYPYILPEISLPTNPQIELMDAGFTDNYGMLTATRFIQVFKDWIDANTSGVVIVQVTGWDKREKLSSTSNDGIIESLFHPLSLTTQMQTLQDYEIDNKIADLSQLLGHNKLEVIRFTYHPMKQNDRASVNLHLTRREKDDILAAFQTSDNQKSLKKLIQLLQ
jgi:hypothetical protein